MENATLRLDNISYTIIPFDISGDAGEDLVVTSVDNACINYPKNNSLFMKQNIIINGTAAGNNFSNYILEYKNSTSPIWALINSSVSPYSSPKYLIFSATVNFP